MGILNWLRRRRDPGNVPWRKHTEAFAFHGVPYPTRDSTAIRGPGYDWELNEEFIENLKRAVAIQVISPSEVKTLYPEATVNQLRYIMGFPEFHKHFYRINFVYKEYDRITFRCESCANDYDINRWEFYSKAMLHASNEFWIKQLMNTYIWRTDVLL